MIVVLCIIIVVWEYRIIVDYRMGSSIVRILFSRGGIVVVVSRWVMVILFSRGGIVILLYYQIIIIVIGIVVIVLYYQILVRVIETVSNSRVS